MNVTANPVSDPVRYEVEGEVAFIVIDNPPVNAGSAAVRVGLLHAIDRLGKDTTSIAGVLIGAGSTFISGSDIKEFEGPLTQPELPAVIAAVENCAKPVLAAIHGAALGGGLELSLGCDARIAGEGSILGLPEVLLGMIPGAGGTQRLPRLAGVSKAIELIVSGRRIKADEALSLGIVDQVVPVEKLRESAADYARNMGGQKRLVSRLSAPEEEADEIAAAESAALRGGRAREQVREAVASIQRSLTVPVEEALVEERAIFQKLRQSTEAAALRYGFFAERAASRVEGGRNVIARPLREIGIVGAGTMGSGIAAVFAAAGFSVRLTDTGKDALDRAEGRIAQAIGDLVRSNRLASDLAAGATAHVSYASDIATIGDADLVIEAIFEDESAKRDIMSKLGAAAREGAVIASNTSYLDLDMLAEASGRPRDVIGLHFFAPVHKMRLVEVVRAGHTLPDALKTGIAAAKAIGKLPVVAGAGEGFIGNRIYARYRAQCEFMLEEGALPHEIDAAAEALGFAMGPFAVSDISGLDIAWAMRKRKAKTRDPRERYVRIADRLCEMGRLGRKTGSGWYDYSEVKSGRGKIDPVVNDIVREEAALYGASRTFAEKEIQGRILGAILNEASLTLTDGVARTPAEIDLVLMNGYGFSKFKGGPIFVASHMEPREVDALLDEVEAASGFGFRRGDVQRMLADCRK